MENPTCSKLPDIIDVAVVLLVDMERTDAEILLEHLTQCQQCRDLAALIYGYGQTTVVIEALGDLQADDLGLLLWDRLVDLFEKQGQGHLIAARRNCDKALVKLREHCNQSSECWQKIQELWEWVESFARDFSENPNKYILEVVEARRDP